MGESLRTPKTQVERTAETRQLLLDATINTLVEKGYAATTIKEICARAGMTRGAPQHHFQTKEQLVLAAVEHLFQARLREFAAGLEKIPKASRTDRLLVDLLWPSFDGPFFLAWLEILTASRTDRELQRAVDEVDRRFDEAILEIARRSSDWPERDLAVFISVLFSFMAGVVLESRFHDSSRKISASAEELLGIVKELITFLGANPKLIRKHLSR